MGVGGQVFSGAEDGEDDISFMKYNTEELETGLDATFHDMSNLEQKGHWLRMWSAPLPSPPPPPTPRPPPRPCPPHSCPLVQLSTPPVSLSIV